MAEKIRIAILASTRGTDMVGIVEAISKRKLDAEISVVIANKECGAIEKAEKYGLKHIMIDGKGRKREEFDREVSKILDEKKIQLIVLVGYMRLMSSWFVGKYRNRIMNIHPSLLPAYAGGMDLNVHEEVLKRGCRVTGASLIFIDEGADTGPIISQKVVDVEDDETPDTLKEKVQKAEQNLLIKGIQLFAEGKLKVEGNKVKVLK